MSGPAPLDDAVLPGGVRSRFLDDVNGLRVHVLEAGQAANPCVLLLHGFPELAYSWRNVMPGLADAGFHVVAPDMRGYRRTTGGDVDYDGDLRGYDTLNVVRDALGVIWALGHREVAGVIGHDMGTFPAAWSALIRPDIFRTVTLLSVPFVEPPGPPRATAAAVGDFNTAFAELRELKPPRKRNQWYNTTRSANNDMVHSEQGLHDFLRAYYHCKSADFTANQPHPLADSTAEELAKLPKYYVMDLGETMPETVAPYMPSPAQITACRWLTEDELDVYVTEYERTGFQGALQWYRVQVGRPDLAELQLFAGREIDVPSMFIAGRSDWAVYFIPGAFERMPLVCTRMESRRFVEDAGHWVQQEQPEAVTDLLVEFLRRRRTRS
jgi:pimeloyl-ACP methyl ester carboxylesterase